MEKSLLLNRIKRNKDAEKFNYLGEITYEPNTKGLLHSHGVYNFYRINENGEFVTISQSKDRNTIFQIINDFYFRGYGLHELKEDIKKELPSLRKDNTLKSHNIYENAPRAYILDYKRYDGINYIMPFNTELTSEMFDLPNGINEFELFMILSYVVDQYKINDHLVCSEFLKFDELLFDELGFEKLDKKSNLNKDLIYLYHIENRPENFKKELGYMLYFDWYVPGVTEEEYCKLVAKMHEAKGKKLGRRI